MSAVRDFGCGSLHTVARAGDASVHYFIRSAADERCVVEHAYPSHSLVFTDTGMWGYHGPERPQLVDPSSVVAGTGLGEYACSHPDGIATRCFVVALSNNALEGESDDLFARSVVPKTSDMVLHRRAIERAMGDAEHLEAVTYSLFDLVAGAAAQRSPRRRIDVRMAYAKRLIRERSAEPITIAGVARDLNVSRFTFTRRFLRHTGMTPHAYLARVRIARAREQLVATTLSVEEIAAANGYGSLAHFSTAFRRSTGSSPTAFRRRVFAGRS